MSEVRDLYEEAVRRFNAGDVDGFANAHAANAVLVTPAGTARGRPAIRNHWRRQRTAFPDLVLNLDLVIEEGDSVASEWTWIGTHTGVLVLGDGTEVPPTGRRVEFKGMELARFRDGEIAEYRMYWDGTVIAAQLGLPTRPTPPAELSGR